MLRSFHGAKIQFASDIGKEVISFFSMERCLFGNKLVLLQPGKEKILQ